MYAYVFPDLDYFLASTTFMPFFGANFGLFGELISKTYDLGTRFLASKKPDKL